MVAAPQEQQDARLAPTGGRPRTEQLGQPQAQQADCSRTEELASPHRRARQAPGAC
jgi:hypothetical protein